MEIVVHSKNSLFH